MPKKKSVTLREIVRLVNRFSLIFSSRRPRVQARLAKESGALIGKARELMREMEKQTALNWLDLIADLPADKSYMGKTLEDYLKLKKLVDWLSR